VFENRVLRKIIEPKVDEVTGEWRRLHDVELHDLHSPPYLTPVIKSRSVRWMGHVARIGEGSSACRVLVKKSETKRSLGRPGHRWEDNIEMHLQEVG